MEDDEGRDGGQHVVHSEQTHKIKHDLFVFFYNTFYAFISQLSLPFGSFGFSFRFSSVWFSELVQWFIDSLWFSGRSRAGLSVGTSNL